MKFPKIILLLLVGVSLLSSPACTPAPTAAPAPTVDVDAIKQEIYQTVVSELTVNAPQATPTTPPTATELPATATVEIPTLTKPAEITVAPASTFTAPASGVATRYPTWTITPYTDRASLSFQNPQDGPIMARGQAFDVTWVIKNIGARDWNNQFYIRHISGFKSSTFSVLMLPPVHRGSETTIVADFTAPHTPGYYVSQWGLVNDDGVTFFRFNFVFSVE